MQNVNWVSKRAGCSLLQMFEKLKLEVESDVEIRKALRPEMAQYGFQFAQSGDSFSVSREGNRHELFATVTFHLTEGAILAKHRNGATFLTIKIMLNDEGECRFKIGDDEYESWQLRRRALEPIFFEGL